MSNMAALFTAMAILAILESVAPFRPKGAWRRGHRAGNLGLNASTIALNAVLGMGGAIVSETLRGRGLGLLAGQPIPAATLVVVGIVTLDPATYLAHWLMHRVPAFWRVHRVHHSDPLVDVTTADRQHPLEGLIRFSFIMAAAWVLGYLSTFDRIFRTFTPTRRAPDVEYGLDGYDSVDAQRFTRLMALPFQSDAALSSSPRPCSGPCSPA